MVVGVGGGWVGWVGRRRVVWVATARRTAPLTMQQVAAPTVGAEACRSDRARRPPEALWPDVDSDSMRIPADAVIAAEKLTGYLPLPRPWDDKAKFLAQAGFDLG